MAKKASGKRYAKAIFELAVAKGELERCHSDLKKVTAVFREDKFLNVLENPKYTFAAKKEAILTQQLGDISPLVMSLASLLVVKGRPASAPAILQDFEELLDRQRGIEHAEFTTAFPISEEEQKVFAQKLGKILDRQVVIEAQVDPGLIGGFRAKINDLLIDGSIRQKLEALKKNLAD
ncbi:MAG: ATP synthase F1 subunit delta [bacterium]|nr:ATP synthase F1 subunit delta [bacterium]